MRTSERSTTPRRAALSASGAAITVAALGVVFGDIGTSPLYAFRESFEGHEIPVDRGQRARRAAR